MNVKLVLGVGVLMLARSIASAEEPKEASIVYSAFDLDAGRIPIDHDAAGYTEGATFVNGVIPGVCVPGLVDAKTLVVTSDLAKTCPMFTSRTPGKFTVQYAKAKISITVTAEFGGYGTFGGTATRSKGQLVIAGLDGAAGNVCAAYFSTRQNKWTHTGSNVSAGVASLDVAPDEASGSLYLKYVDCHDAKAPVPEGVSAVLRVDFPAPPMHDILDHGEFCKDGRNRAHFEEAYLEKKNHVDYCVCIDEANAAAQARIVFNKRHYIKPFEWGRLVVRHWSNVTPTVTINGAVASIRQPGLAGSIGDAGPSGPSATASGSTGFSLPSSSDGQGFTAAPQDDGSVISEIYLPPHAPGTMHIDIRFLDPADSKPKAATAVDLIVDQSYAGAFRVGLAHDSWVNERTYRKLQRFKDGPMEISESVGEPTEVFIGYSIFLGGPRSYGLTGPWWKQHLAGLIGFGALAYTPSQPVDFLRSFYLGGELEVSRHFSVGLTLVIHRNTELDGFKVGGPAPVSDLPTRGTYDAGVGLVFMVSPDFVKVAGGSK